MSHPIMIALLFILLLPAACKREKEAATGVETTQPTKITVTSGQREAIGIVTGKISSRVISGVIRANGILDVPPQNLVSIAAPLAGFVKNTGLLQGMKITKGQVLVSLEGPDFIQLQQDYLTSKSQLEYLRLEYDRQKELARENINATKTVELAKANFLGTRAKTEGYAAMLSLIHIDPAALEKGSIQNTIMLYSPINGYITQVNVNIGMHVNPTDVMFRIVDTEDLHAEAQVFEKDISELKIGQKVRVMLSNDPVEHEARVYLIGREITAERTVRVHCHFDKEDLSMIPGMYFSATIEIDSRSVPALPDEAIVTSEGKKYIFKEIDKLNFEILEIRTGASQSGYTEVDTNIRNENVVFKGAYDLLSMLKNNEN